MHGYDAREAFYQNCDIWSWVKFLIRQGQYCHIKKMYIMLGNRLLLGGTIMAMKVNSLES